MTSKGCGGGAVRVISLCPDSDLPFVLVRLECVAVTIAELNSMVQQGEWTKVGKSSFLCSSLFSWASYAASEVLICAESAWKRTKSGTRPFHPPCLGMKIKLKTHKDYNCLFGVLLLE